MRRCRNRLCQREFLPLKPHYFCCTWDCYQAHMAEPGHDYRGYERERQTAYDIGYRDGLLARPAPVIIDRPMWTKLITLCHVDRWAGAPTGVQRTAHEATIWLLMNRPG
jgi:hypothetical protein